MKKVLISSFDMEIGGVERSLISMLDNFDYDNYDVDLMLYSHSGDLFNLLPKKPKLLKEDKKYKTFRLSIAETIKSGNIDIAISRLLARSKAKKEGYKNNLEDYGYIQMQYMWKYCLRFLPQKEKYYDIAISYLWPHYFVADKVNADTKIAWIHTDFSKLDTDVDIDLSMWDKFDYIAAVSEDCKNAFLNKYPSLREKVTVIENITSPHFVRKLAEEKIDDLVVEEDVFKVISVGRYSEAKGFDNAIKALRILHDRGYTNIKWYIIGYGGDEELYRNLIKENNLEDSFILLGKKTNPYPYMKNCDIYAQPSRYEGKAVTVTEAQILGKPVMLTNYTTAYSQVKDMVDGYITDLSIEGIADGIEYLNLNSDLRKSMSSYCQKTDYSNYIELDKLYTIMCGGYDNEESKYDSTGL
ncbi:glycosyltransferase [Terrisporobacter vanillatitrophus]|uniref:glycosyltransferase n=1 Tax=Terrisporobacter vanillatitrophus TaxID=3058402 RepID=UPI00336913F1